MLNQEIINYKMKMEPVTSEENAMLIFVSIILKIGGHDMCILTIFVKTRLNLLTLFRYKT